MKAKECCAVVVTYNRKDLLQRNIERNLAQNVKHDILIVDNNSYDGTDQMLVQRGYLMNERIIYHRNTINAFGSGGFHFGLDYVFSHGYRYAWLMDDDGYPMRGNTLWELLNAAAKLNENNVVLNSAVLCGENRLTFTLNGITSFAELKLHVTNKRIPMLENIAPAFNGTLISKGAFEKTGNIRKDFIIHGDEKEFCARAMAKGATVGTIVDSQFYHPNNGELGNYIRGGNIYQFRYRIPWTEYYESRNHVYVRKKYGNKEDLEQYMHYLKLKIACIPHDKMAYTYYICRGMWAGMHNDFTPLKRHRYLKDSLKQA